MRDALSCLSFSKFREFRASVVQALFLSPSPNARGRSWCVMMRFLSENSSQDAFGQYGDIEIDEQAHAQLAQAQIREQLGFVDGGKAFDRLQFNQHALVNDEVDAVPAVKLHTFILERQVHFRAKCNASQSEFAAQARLIRGFKQSRS